MTAIPGAPDELCLTTIIETPIASIVSAVSMNDSPLERLLPDAEKSTVSALSRLAAMLNEVRVRVEGSKNRLATTAPDSDGSFRSPPSKRPRRRAA